MPARGAKHQETSGVYKSLPIKNITQEVKNTLRRLGKSAKVPYRTGGHRCEKYTICSRVPEDSYTFFEIDKTILERQDFF